MSIAEFSWAQWRSLLAPSCYPGRKRGAPVRHSAGAACSSSLPASPGVLTTTSTRKLSAADPLQIAMIKGLAAGAVNLALALAHGAPLPGFTTLAAAAVVGFFGYGVSLVLFVLGLRHLGAARTGAYFSTAPFIGAALALPMFGEPPTFTLIGAALLMGIGVYLHLAEAHDHEHLHEPLEHEHRHVHDIRHLHEHAPDVPAGEPHSHWHRHPRVLHKHPHYPDLHHRHEHQHA